MAGSKAVPLTSVSEIDTYIDKICETAQHHAKQVEPIVEPLARAVLARLDLTKDTVWVSTRLGKIANACWVTISGKEYFFSYNQGARKIEIRLGTKKGIVIHQFDKENSVSDIQAAIATL